MDAPIVVRPATLDDVDAIVDVHLQGRTAYYTAGGHIAESLSDPAAHRRRHAARSGLLEVWQRNTRAQDFYLKHGWHPDGARRPGPEGVDYLLFRLDLGLSRMCATAPVS